MTNQMEQSKMMSECAARGSRPRAIKLTYTCTKCGFCITAEEPTLYRQRRNHHRRYHQGRAVTKLPIALGGGISDITNKGEPHENEIIET